MWYSQDSPISESHCKYIQGEFLYTSNPEQLPEISNDFVVGSLPRQEEWLNLDDIDLKTSPSDYPPPSRPPPPPEKPGKVNQQANKVTNAFNRNLSMLLDDSTTSTSSSIKTVVDRKGKGILEESDSSTMRQPSAAVAEMKARDMKQQLEMEEVARAADELQHEFKKWAAGKQGNIRALLSSLQNILGPEFRWQPIPMTDLLDPGAVRKQYKRAALLVHPDKLQQKGASPRQKYIAEQVFGLLKEASRKFNSEELF
ncbi:hypothetical protein R1sor_004593 [Riccia sorocarpa]|uniref:J domain-containing protein n=1 Tax=Riccia sorocarpa TaxID=122646 RepID=A0ABD3HKM7_9MARC